jgi:hypothetical protein
VLSRKNQKKEFPQLDVDITTLEAGGQSSPVVKLSGTVPPGSEGNDVMAKCFADISERIDLSSADVDVLAYDLTDLHYEFGDHLGAFLWILPALLDGVCIMVAVGGETRANLESLNRFIGEWLPLAFCDSVASIEREVDSRSQTMNLIARKRDACSQQGQIIPPEETGVPLVMFGSRQLGVQYRTGNPCKESCDLDIGVIGGPRELAILILKTGHGGRQMPNMEHPPSKAFASAHEVEDQGLCAIFPRGHNGQ